jgi:branched-chain amino acid transport system permease protein
VSEAALPTRRSGLDRDVIAFSLLGVVILLVILTQGPVYSSRMLVEAGCYAIIALGLNIQWGYAGLFNVGIMGFIAAGAATAMIISYPQNPDFWNSGGPMLVAGLLARLVLATALIWAANRSTNWGLTPRLKIPLVLIAVAFSWIMVSSYMDPMASSIEEQATWIGGLGLPVFVGWIGAAVVAGAIGWFVGKVCLGLRTDYLAIATLGFAQIIKHFLKNADWLTKGTLTVSPLPWPVPKPEDGEFLLARSLYLCVVAVLIVLIYLALQRAYHAPWGRMMRAIRDNEDAAEAMGKNVNQRRLEIFVFGCMLIGLGGAVLISFTSVFDPAAFVDLNHTFLIWVMVIVGGAGNNRGAIFGALLIYIIWTMSEPVALWLFGLVRDVGLDWFGWVAPADLDSRALQMRVFVIGLTITLVLRIAPRGALPEQVSHRS